MDLSEDQGENRDDRSPELGRVVKIHEKKIKKKNLHDVSCHDEGSAYVIGHGAGILLEDRSGRQLDNISTKIEPYGLAVMQDGSLIYSDNRSGAIYRVSPKERRTEKFIDAESIARGLCCTRAGDILVCVGFPEVNTGLSASVVKYSSSGQKIETFPGKLMSSQRFVVPDFVCENLNGDICVSDQNYEQSKVVVFERSGEFRFNYYGNMSAGSFRPRGVATDSSGRILIADAGNHLVHLIRQNGDFLSYILTKDDGISEPRGISVDTSDNLWLVEYDTACVKVYQSLSCL